MTILNDIQKNKPLLKFVVNTDSVADLLTYLDKETERQKQAIAAINNQLLEISAHDQVNTELAQNIDKYNSTLNEIIRQFTEQENRMREQIKDLDSRTSLICRKIGINPDDPSTTPTIYNIPSEIKSLQEELQIFKKNTAELLGVDEKELNRRPETDEPELNEDGSPHESTSNRSQSKKEKEERMTFMDVVSELKKMKEEFESQKENSELIHEFGLESPQSIRDKIEQQREMEETFKQIKNQVITENDKTAINQDISMIHNDIDQIKLLLNDQKQKIDKSAVSIDDYVQEVLQQALNADESKKEMETNFQHLKDLLNASIQSLQSQMASITDSFNDMATKDDLMATFAELMNPRSDGTSIGVKKCRCLACGQYKPTVNTITDSNLAEIMHYHPLRRSETSRPGTKVTLMQGDPPHSSRPRQTKNLLSPRKTKTSML